MVKILVFLGKYSHGTNGIGYNYMGSVAGKARFDNVGSIGALFGYSKRKISQNYEVGGVGKIDEKVKENPFYSPNEPISEWNQPYESSKSFSADELTQRPKSYLFKIETKPDDYNKAILSYRRYENLLAVRDMIHDNYQLDYKFNSDNNFVNIDFLASYGEGEKKYLSDAVFFGRPDITNKRNLKTSNKTLILNLGNTAKFHLDALAITSKFGVNQFLKPVEAQTWQIGFNSYKENLFLDNDIFGFKILYYKIHVDDFIYNKSFYTTDAFMLHLNQTKTTKFSGVEAKVSYDAQNFYIKASYSNQKSNQTVNEISGVGSNSFGGYTEITELPKNYATIDKGTRLYNKKLTIGMLAKYTRSAKKVTVNENNRYNPNDYFPEQKTEKLPDSPMIYDFYMILKLKENLTFEFKIKNLFDKNYMDVLNAFYETSNQLSYDANGNDVYLFDNQARSRTVAESFEYKF